MAAAHSPPPSHTSYEQRLNRVTDYIYEHLNAPLDLERLAQIAHLSPYHWHRVYHAMRGETIAATVKRLRLQRAAALLVQSELSVAEIAARAGYPSLASFTRIFRAAHGMPPGRYRQHGNHVEFQAALGAQHSGALEHRVRVCQLPAQNLICVAHRGAYINIGQAFDKLYGALSAQGLSHATVSAMGVYQDDPAMVSASALRSWAGVAGAAANCKLPLQSMELAAGRHAVLRYQGPYATMHAAYRWLFGKWLPLSGYEPADAPVFENYVNDPRGTAPTELLTDIYLPLR